MQKVDTVTNKDIVRIGQSLREIFDARKETYRGLSQRSGLSVNSVKAILNGATANIASYDIVARALATSLLEVCSIVWHTKPAATVPNEEEDKNIPVL